MNLFKKKPKVQLVNVGATSIQEGNSLFVTVDPAFADMCPEIRDSLVDLVGHTRVEVWPLPKGAIQFFQAEVPFTIAINDGERFAQNV